MRILVTSIGSTGAQGVIKSLRTQDIHRVELIGTDMAPDVAGRAMVDRFHQVPHASRDDVYRSRILEIVDSESIDAVIPIMDPEQLVLSAGWPSGIDCRLVGPGHEVLSLVTNKLRLYSYLDRHGFRTPEIYGEPGIFFPAFLKPVVGTGSNQARRVDTRNQLETARNDSGVELVVQEYIEGSEYSIDCYADLEGVFVGAVPRIRERVKGGLAVASTTVEAPFLVAEADRLLTCLGYRGPANVQVIERQGEYFFTDFNPRFGGAYTASIRAGLDGPRFLADELAGREIDYSGYRVGLKMVRYWTEVYWDENGNLV